MKILETADFSNHGWKCDLLENVNGADNICRVTKQVKWEVKINSKVNLTVFTTEQFMKEGHFKIAICVEKRHPCETEDR